jgi:hypothetical protein
MLNQGLQKIRSLIASNLTTGEMGTGTTGYTPSDTGLETAVAGSNKTLEVAESDRQLTISYLLDSASATGNTFTEFEVNDGSGNAINRIVFTGIAHTASTEINIKQRFFIKSN